MRGFPKRRPVRKGPGARAFRKDVARTHVKNVSPRPMRGGIRL